MTEQQFLQDYLHRYTPLTVAMGITVVEASARRVVLAAPLAPNINDKGTGFAVATSGLATLTGWAQTMLILRQAGIDGLAVVYASELYYPAPATGDFRATCNAPDDAMVARFLHDVAGGRGKLPLQVTVESAGICVVELKGKYAATPGGKEPT